MTENNEEHLKRAEELLEYVDAQAKQGVSDEALAPIIALTQVHATLATATVTVTVPAELSETTEAISIAVAAAMVEAQAKLKAEPYSRGM